MKCVKIVVLMGCSTKAVNSIIPTHVGLGNMGFNDAIGTNDTFSMESVSNPIPSSISQSSISTSYKTKKQSSLIKQSITTDKMMDQLILSQLSNGSWKYDVDILQHLIKESLDVYRKSVNDITDENVFMTLMVISYFNNHPEYYATYNRSTKLAETYVTVLSSDFKQNTLSLIKFGFN